MNNCNDILIKARDERKNQILGSFANLNYESVDTDSLMEKSDVLRAFDGGDDIKITKKGKEIKNQINLVLLPKFTTRLAKYEAEAASYLANSGDCVPNRDISPYETAGIVIRIDHKLFDWKDMSPSCATSSCDGIKVSSEDAEPTESVYDIRRKYNDAVRMICEVTVDIKTCEVMQDLKDNVEYQLTPRQVLSLHF